MTADSQASVQPIVQHVVNELEATNAFDPAITYSKGQAVLRMLETHIGPDNFLLACTAAGTDGKLGGAESAG